MTRHLLTWLGAVVVLLLTGCGHHDVELDPASMTVPVVGDCRSIDQAALTAESNDSPAVACDEPHDDETFVSGQLPSKLAEQAYESNGLEQWAYRQCDTAFSTYLGTDDSTAMRSVLTWVWFRPSQQAWAAGARWYRCDMVGGTHSDSLLDLPTTTKDLLRGNPDDQWMACARGQEIDSSVKVPCTSKHQWRAVTTIKLGEPDDAYPGDAAVESKTKSYCSDSVDAWLGYPADFDFGFTWFDSSQWDAGNRRSICWARTDQ